MQQHDGRAIARFLVVDCRGDNVEIRHRQSDVRYLLQGFGLIKSTHQHARQPEPL